MEQEQHQGSHRCEHSQEKHEGDSPVVHVKDSGDSEEGNLNDIYSKVSQSATCTERLLLGFSDPCPARST